MGHFAIRCWHNVKIKDKDTLRNLVNKMRSDILQYHSYTLLLGDASVKINITVIIFVILIGHWYDILYWLDILQYRRYKRITLLKIHCIAS